MQILSKVSNRYKKEGFKVGTIHFLSYLLTPMKNLGKYITKIIIRFENKFSIKEMVVLECESDMDDNPRAIYECLLCHKWNDKHKIIWLVQDVKNCQKLYKEKNVKFLNRLNGSNWNQIKLNYFLSRSKWFFFSHPYWFYKSKDEQIVVNTDHGSTINKKKANGEINDIKTCSFDWILVPTEFSQRATYNFWPCRYEQMFFCGRPANDFLFQSDLVDLKSVISGYNEGEKIIICMPTYKESKSSVDNKIKEKYLIDVVQTENQMKDLNFFLRQKGVHLILKAHPMQLTDELQSNSFSNIHYIFNKDLFLKKVILYRLIGCCDALITDLSSVYIDYLMLNRPVAFFMNSVRNYSRGFNIDNFEDYLPGMKIFSYEDLKQFITDVCQKNDLFQEERLRVNTILNPPKEEYSEAILKRFNVL